MNNYLYACELCVCVWGGVGGWGGISKGQSDKVTKKKKDIKNE